MNCDEQCDRLRLRMAELRRELSCDVQEVGRSAREMVDVGLYVRRFPWISVGVAFAVGYLLVPSRKEIVRPDPAMLAKMLKQSQVRVEAVSGAPRPQEMLKGLLTTGMMSAARIGMNFVIQRMAGAATPTKYADQSAAPTARETSEA